MASNTSQTSPVNLPSKAAQDLLVNYINRILTEHKKFSDYFSKMEAVDIAYARYQANLNSDGQPVGDGVDAATTPVGVFNLPSTTPPVVVSQVDSMVGYLAEVFLSGYPLFPVVSTPENANEAEMLETLVDDHATIGGYPRQLLMFIRDAVKYNVGAVEADWSCIDQYTASTELLSPGKQKINKSSSYYTKLKRLDMYNTIWDKNVLPGDVSAMGDYAGYVELLSQTKMKRELNRLSIENKAMNVKEALKSNTANAGILQNFRIHPKVSDYINPRKPMDGMNWYTYITGKKEADPIPNGDNFEKIVLYIRIQPNDFALHAPAGNTPQIWKVVLINGAVIVQCERIISAYDYLPILFAQPLEDGLGFQTQSVAESTIPFQTAAATLFNIRFNSARRAVSDRALFDPDRISQVHINAPVPAAKIPVQSNALSGKPISDAYHQIPFDPRGTEGALQDGLTIIGFSKDVIGLNNPRQGQFQKGNKSVTEWNDTMAGGDSRLRLPALCLEYQFFIPLKMILKLNIYQYGSDAVVVSQKSGKTFDIKMAALRDKVLQFRIADGYTPKSKLASTDAITQFMQLIGQSQILQQAYGSMLPGMLAHLAQLMGIRELSQYSPNAQQQLASQTQQAMLAQGVNPQNGQSFLPPQAGQSPQQITPVPSQPVDGSAQDLS